MDITNSFVSATIVKAYANGTSPGALVLTKSTTEGNIPLWCNCVLVTNVSGAAIYTRLLIADNQITGPTARSANWTLGNGWSRDGDRFKLTDTTGILTETTGSLTVGKQYMLSFRQDFVSGFNDLPTDTPSDTVTAKLGTTSCGTAIGTQIKHAVAAAATNGKVSFTPDSGADTLYISGILAEPMASATIGEYDLIIPDGETIDVTLDGRVLCYGVSVWAPTGNADGAVNVRGRVIAGRNKQTTPP